MLFFIDESWQQDQTGKTKVGVLAAIQIKAHNFNQLSSDIYQLKVKNLGYELGNIEIKGRSIFREYSFNLEKRGMVSQELSLARNIFDRLTIEGANFFASRVFAEQEITLNCADENHLDRPFFYLFERINLFMEENYPSSMAHLIFDDRGAQDNSRISSAVSNFLHKSHIGKRFDNIIKFPSFAISTKNVGLQIADMAAYLLAKRHFKPAMIQEFDKKLKKLEFKSRQLFKMNEREYPLYGFKTVGRKEKEAGDLFDPNGSRNL